MQWLFNLIYKALDMFFGLIGQISTPSWITDITVSISRFCVIANYYFPLDTLVAVGLTVIGITAVMMIVSAILQVL